MAEEVFKTVKPELYVPEVSAEEGARRFYEVMRKRRSVRMFSTREVSLETMEWVVRAGQSAPSGANKQPWRFVCVRNAVVKREIRLGAEAEEREFYRNKAGEEWLADLAPLGTDEDKGFLEVAPWLVVVFKLASADDGGQTYYVNESVGIAVGMLLCAAHHAGLSTLTHTPSPMKFLTTILKRPANERPFLLIPMGYPAKDVVVPEMAVGRKPLGEAMVVV